MTRADAAVVAYWVTFGAVLALLLTSCTTPQAPPDRVPPGCRSTIWKTIYCPGDLKR